MKSRRHTSPRSYRVELTETLRRKYEHTVLSRPVSELSKDTGLPYLLIYNIVNARVRSVSPRHFRLLFGEDPPAERIARVEGRYFRQMVDLWLFLDGRTTKTALYNELVEEKPSLKADYRIFSGKIETVNRNTEKKMEKKFLDAGIDRKMLSDWISEYSTLPKRDRIPYQKIRPLLLFLKRHAGIHPNAILNQQMDRYESGRLKSISRTVFEHASHLKIEVEKALVSGHSQEILRLRETIYGKKDGYTLYTDVEEELLFLKTAANKRPKQYLGRGPSAYEKGKCKRIPSWRAERIHNDCSLFIANNPTIALMSLPLKQRIRHIAPMLNLLVQRAADILLKKEGLVVEKQILAPSRTRTEYEKAIYGFTRFDRASTALGMRKRAFDLMVSQNCDIFRQVGKYSHSWYLSDLYLEEILGRVGFGVISAKYELLSRRLGHTVSPANACMN